MSKVCVNVSIDEKINNELDKICEKFLSNKSKIVNQALIEYLEKNKKEK